MRSEVRQAFLDFIFRRWEGYARYDRPDRMLVREYALMPEDDLLKNIWPERFWVLDSAGYHEQCVVQSQRLQAIEQLVPDGNVLKRGRCNIPLYETGNVTFAPFAEEGTYYLGWVFGPRCGRGFRCRIEEDGRITQRERLWIS